VRDLAFICTVSIASVSLFAVKVYMGQYF
jgi:hypothetical protein